MGDRLAPHPWVRCALHAGHDNDTTMLDVLVIGSLGKGAAVLASNTDMETGSYFTKVANFLAGSDFRGDGFSNFIANLSHVFLR